MDNRATTDRTPAGNSGHPKAKRNQRSMGCLHLFGAKPGQIGRDSTPLSLIENVEEFISKGNVKINIAICRRNLHSNDYILAAIISRAR
jgi:hypothetical protein